MFKISIKKISLISIISALYVVLSIIAFPLASGVIQIRLGEALSFLPLFLPESIISLFLGCFITNIITGCTVIDIIVGSLVTLVSATLTFIVGKIIKNNLIKIIIGGLIPVLLNGFIIPLIWYFLSINNEKMYIINCLFVLVGESISVFALGIPTCFYLKKLKEKNII